MDDITPKPTPIPPQPKRGAEINLFARLREARDAAKNPPGAKPAKQEPPISAATVDKSNVPQVLAGVLAVLVVIGIAVAAYLWATKKETPAVVESAAPSPSFSPKPTPKPSPTFMPRPKQPAPPPAPAPATYTVQSGDTLITIGEKLHKDWQAIAAANGNISDPNLIFPGQVLTIP